MADPYTATRNLLEERPELAATLEELLDVDDSGPWTFDDIAVGSGTFGELVSRGIVEKEDNAYQIADREAVRAAIEGDPYGEDDGTDSTISDRLRDRAAEINPAFIGALLLSLGFLFVFRVLTYRRIFRAEMVVLPGNDPYHYRYQVDKLLAASPDPFSLSEIGEVLGQETVGEPLVPTIGYWVTLLFEGNPETAGVAIAWIPVVAALLVGCLVAWMALAITADERLAVLSVLALAMTPAHALYSGLGFFDHSALDYLWLSVIAATLVWIARDFDRHVESSVDDPVRTHLVNPATWAISGVFGLAVVAAVFNWNGSPILLIGIAVYGFFRSGSDLRAGFSPAASAAPVVSGLAFAAVLAHGIHIRSGWQEPAIVYAPLLVLTGLVAVIGVAEACTRVEWISPRAYIGGVPAALIPLVAGAWILFPDIVNRFVVRAGDVVGRGGIAETRNLITADYGIFFGGVDMFGWLLFITLPALVWVSWRSIKAHEPRWLVPSSFAWPLLGFLLFQIRFAGELAPFAAIFTGVGVLFLLAKLDLASPPTFFGDRSRVAVSTAPLQQISRSIYIVFVLLLVASLSLFMVPITMDSAAHEESQVEAIEWMSADAAEHNREEFVVSNWGDQRLYNYHVFGGGDTYSVSAQHDMVTLLESTSPDKEYDRFDSGVGYIVLPELDDANVTDEQGYTRLVEHLGTASGDVDGVGHFRAQFVSSDRTYVVFTPVPGATIKGTGQPDERVVVETPVKIPGAEFTYTRYATPNAEGNFTVTVAHPGTYDVGNQTVTVTEADVREGRTVTTQTDGQENDSGA